MITEQAAFLRYCTRDTGEQHNSHVHAFSGAPYEDDVLDDDFDDLPELDAVEDADWEDSWSPAGSGDLIDADSDIDVCTCCGRYFSYSDYLKELWAKGPHFHAGSPMPQFCEPCMSGKPPRHEY